MQLSRDSVTSLLSCVACVQQYRQINKGYPLNKPVAIKKTSTHVQGWAVGLTLTTTLHDVVESITGKQIDIVEFDEDIAPAIEGMCVESNERSIIFVKRSLNYCWRRFTVAKELAHLLMNHANGSLRSTGKADVLSTIHSLIMKQISSSSSPATIAEVDAYAGAVEMLYPKDTVDYCASKTFSSREIAELVKVPNMIIDIRNDDVETRAMHQQVYDDSRYNNAILHERVKRANP